MCGITGIWNFNRSPVAESDILIFNNSLTHRGPDGSGVWRDDLNGLVLAHRRLAILDLTEAGAQPMEGSSGRYIITYNGEIYNFIELRASLIELGYVFKTETDTEVILAAYDQWGEGMMHHLNGMWALAIWDNLNKTLFIARDRFGIKPLHYYLSAKQFCFASELKSFRSLAEFTPELDLETAQVLVADPFRVEGTRRTLIKSVHRLQGGHCATVYPNGEISIRRWWHTLDHLIEPPATFEEQVEQYNALFRDSVRLRMRSDVPLGTCLSGGFDSTAVLCTMREIGSNSLDKRVATDWQHAFIASFPNALNDERKEAEQVLAYTKIKGTILDITEKDATQEIEKILFDFDDVYISLPSAPWLLYREMRRCGVVVSLDGHGADELMGGYKHADFLYLHNAPSLLLSPFKNIRILREMHAHLGLSKAEGRLAQLLRDAHSIIRFHPTFARLRQLRRRARGKRINQITTKAQYSDSDFSLPWEHDDMPKHWDATNADFYHMFHATTLPTILRNFDRVSMAHGVEVRMPFMDYRLVCFVMSLSSTSKIGELQTKYIAREAMKDKMPESIRTSKIKIGFNSPMPEWLNGPLKNWCRTLFNWGLQNPTLSDTAKKVAIKSTVNWQSSSKYWTPLNLFWFARKLKD
jgi:asparagine synthase (glutamine-hydrolysing)